MPDLNSDALGIWEHLKPAIDKEIEQKTRGMVQRRKMKVTTAPSIATGKIGVTEAFGSEMSIPFATNLISATVGDMVWVEFMYGATNAFASMFASADEKDWDVAGDLTVHGVLDVTQRRAYNTLNTVGWRRVMTTTFNNQYGARGATGFIVRLDITSSFNNANNEVHSITLLAVYNKLAFVDESSSSNGLYIDKIRYTQQDNVGHIDIHYNTTSMNMVTCAFAIESEQYAKRATVSESLQSVADSPSGETVLTEYTFSANGTIVGGLTVNSVLDVTPRRCYGSLVSAGWYRVCAISFNSYAEAAGAAGGILRFAITDSYASYPNDAHTIDLLLAHNKVTFVNEASAANGYLEIDKIRYTFTETSPYNGYVDIHFLGRGGATYVGISFDYAGISLDRQARVVAKNLQSVAASPSGETVLATYTFAANTEADGTVVGASGFTPDEIEVKRSGRVVYVHFYVRNVSIAANTHTLIGTLSGVPFPNKSIRWLAGGGAHAYDAVTPVYAILETNGNIRVTSPSAISAVNITISYIV